MALKDWKKTYSDLGKKNTYKSIDGKILVIFKLGNKGMWNVRVLRKYLRGNKYSKIYVAKLFKTKAQAIKYAKNYMRKH